MPLMTIHRSVLIAIAIALAGCAAVGAPVKDRTVLSKSAADKLAPGAKASKEAEAQPALELDGAIRQAQSERKAGDLITATKTLSQLVLVAPDDSRVLGEYGKTLVAMGRSDDALAFLERAIQLQPADWSLFSAQGVAFDQKSQYLEAQASYDRALSLKPGEPTVLSNNALSHMQSGDLDGAEELLLEAAKAGGNYPRIASNLALVQSLKASRARAGAAPAKTVSEVPAPIEPQMSNSGTAPAVAAAPTPAASEPAPEAVPEAPPVAVVEPPVERAALPVPAGEAAGSPASLQSPLRSSSLEALATNPSVRMQAVPKDDRAGPVPVARKRPAPQSPVIAKAAPDANAAPDQKPQDTSDSFLRPALVEATAGK